MSKAYAMMRSKLMAALAKIGKNNGHACPETGSNTDHVMHEFLVSSDAKSFFTKRADNAKKELLTIIDNDAVKKAEARVKKNMMGETVTIAEGELYTTIVDIKAPASRFNKTVLRNELAKMGWQDIEIDALIEDCTDQNAPAKTYKVIARE